eukprot:Awhi_evm1s55
MEHIRSFKDLSINHLQAYLSENCDKPPFEKSLLYSSETDSKFVDEDLRKSVF